MGTRAHHRREARRRARGHLPLNPDATYGTTVGWCEAEESLADVRQQTHDHLIRLMGDARTGGVQWLTYTGAAALSVVSRMALDTPSSEAEQLQVYHRCRDLLTEHGGWLVVAVAEGQP